MGLWISWGDTALTHVQHGLAKADQKTLSSFELCTKPWDGAVDKLFTYAAKLQLARLTALCLFFNQLFQRNPSIAGSACTLSLQSHGRSLYPQFRWLYKPIELYLFQLCMFYRALHTSLSAQPAASLCLSTLNVHEAVDKLGSLKAKPRGVRPTELCSKNIQRFYSVHKSMGWCCG